MGEVVNLRRVRKGKARAADAQQAEANRLAFGRTKTERLASTWAQERAEQTLEGHRLPPSEPQP